jgi:sugar transferase (PEP-CTERM/EpsH1 system associated)
MGTQRKNILFLANRVPFPPDKGDKIRTFHQLDHLAMSHDVYCACFVESQSDMAHARLLRRWCADVATVRWNRKAAAVRAAWGWMIGKPLTCGAYGHRQMHRLLAHWAREVDFDVVVAFSSSMAPFALSVPAPRRVLDLCDVDSQKWTDYARRARFPWSMVYRSEGRRLRRFEESCLDAFDATVLITDRERNLLDPHQSCASLHVIPNGATLPLEAPKPASQCGPIVGFLGAMDYRPNVEGICWFADRVWPRVLRCVRDARLLIVGRNPVRRVRRLARLPGVEVTGEVDNVRRYLLQCRAVIAPMHIARGLQNKVLEAMALKRPVVATTAVAEGLQVLSGHNILVADEEEEYAEKVVALCDFDGFCDKVGEAGYRCVATYYSWAETLRRYEDIILGTPVATPRVARAPTEAACESRSDNRKGRTRDITSVCP